MHQTHVLDVQIILENLKVLMLNHVLEQPVVLDNLLIIMVTVRLVLLIKYQTVPDAMSQIVALDKLSMQMVL